jgi:ribosomal protein S18 acetylase RimI-like enzyme
MERFCNRLVSPWLKAPLPERYDPRMTKGGPLSACAAPVHNPRTVRTDSAAMPPARRNSGFGRASASLHDIAVTMNDVAIRPYSPEFRDKVLSLTVEAWAPVFPRTRNEVPGFVFDAFYPQGWQARQTADVASLLDNESDNIWLALRDGELLGFVGLRLHPEDHMGEICIIAVSPDRQRQGIGRTLMDFAERLIRSRGLKMVMVETVDDAGHQSARSAYEASGYERWPVARYFKRL